MPLLVSGGAGDIDDIYEIFSKCDVDGVCLASILHYSNLTDGNFLKENIGSHDFIKNFKCSKNYTIKEIKMKLIEKKIPVRL